VINYIIHISLIIEDELKSGNYLNIIQTYLNSTKKN